MLGQYVNEKKEINKWEQASLERVGMTNKDHASLRQTTGFHILECETIVLCSLCS